MERQLITSHYGATEGSGGPRRLKKAIVVVAAVLAFVALAVFLFADRRKTTGEPTINMGVEFVDHAAAAHIAQNKRWFEAAGIKLRSYDTYVTGMALVAALAKGDIDVAYVCLIPAISAFANAKVPLRIVAGTHKYGYSLVINPKKIRMIKDLERPDIRLGCAREGSPLDVLMHIMIDQRHLSAEKILTKVQRMSPPNILLALSTGQLDAGFLCEQFPTMGEQLGLEVLLSARDLWPQMQGSVVVVRDELIDDHPEIVRKIVDVTRRGTQYIRDHPWDAASIVATELQADRDQTSPTSAKNSLASQTLTPRVVQRSLTTRMEFAIEIDPKQIQRTIDRMAELGNISESFPAQKMLHLEFIK